ncbi:MAG TPA: DUF3159 domain-containing protein [Jatrophihabitans sp.]|nr:DUF3159 domain-containing protein [Jatrophihabitans sp.]
MADPGGSSAADELRERTRQQLLASLGGWSGTVISAVPLVVFVAVNAAASLRVAIWSAVGVAVLLACYRLVRRQSIQQAGAGLVSVLVAAAIAAHTGQARGFFLLGIAGSILYAAAFLLSLLVRRPLVGLLWEFLDPAPLPAGTSWWRVPPLRRAYDWATLAGLAMFAARALVQLSLFRDNKTGWLAITKIAMGFPLYLVVLGFGFWVVRRARRDLPPVAELVERALEDAVELTPGEDGSGGADRPADGRFGLGQGHEQ